MTVYYVQNNYSEWNKYYKIEWVNKFLIISYYSLWSVCIYTISCNFCSAIDIELVAVCWINNPLTSKFVDIFQLSRATKANNYKILN